MIIFLISERALFFEESHVCMRVLLYQRKLLSMQVQIEQQKWAKFRPLYFVLRLTISDDPMNPAVETHTSPIMAWQSCFCIVFATAGAIGEGFYLVYRHQLYKDTNNPNNTRYVQYFCRQLCKVFNIEVQIHGEIPHDPALWVSNCDGVRCGSIGF